MYGIGAYFSIRDAIQAFTGGSVPFQAPMTPERVLLGLHGERQAAHGPSVDTETVVVVAGDVGTERG